VSLRTAEAESRVEQINKKHSETINP